MQQTGWGYGGENRVQVKSVGRNGGRMVGGKRMKRDDFRMRWREGGEEQTITMGSSSFPAIGFD